MKVAFLKPPVGGILGLEMLTFVEPLGPICVAACVEQDGHECAVFDLRIDGEDHGLALCRAFVPDIVGLKCNFCSVWKFHESTFREKSPERVVRELQGIEAPSIFITDDIFWMNVRRGEEMARQIKAAGIKKFFTVQTRTDIICKFPHLIEMWKDCGSLAIFLGLESVTDEGLKAVNKKNTADNNIRAINILKDLGVGFTPNFIVDPAWDRDDFARLRDWIDNMGAYNSGFSILTPLPGTDLWDTAKQQVLTHDWEMYDIVHTVLPTKLPLDEFYSEYSGLWRHALDVRYRYRGKMRTYLQLGAALATRKVTFGALRKGMNIAKVFSKPETFLRAHRLGG